MLSEHDRRVRFAKDSAYRIKQTTYHRRNYEIRHYNLETGEVRHVVGA